MKTNARIGAWALLISLLSSPFASILLAQTNAIIPLSEALDGPAWAWQATGSIPWNGENLVTHDGVDAAQSGAIPDGTSCGVRMTVAGPGTITFWWKVSSETNNDFLSFRFGNSEWARISGEVGWQQVTMYAPGNNLTFEWRYTKNASLAAGQDGAWVDQVEFVPSANPSCSYYIGPRTTSHGYGSTTGTVYVGTSGGCDWNVSNTNSWLTILSSESGVGNGYVVYAVAANTNIQSRSGNIKIGEGIFPLTQAGHSLVSLPADQIVALGDTVAFSVTVNLAPPFTYQWQFNGVDLVDGGNVSGASTANLVLTDVQYSQGGHYRVVASNLFGAEIGSSATLTVAPTTNTLPFAEALDTGDMFFWKTWADSRGNWFGQTNTSHDAIDALECSGLTPHAYASLEAKSGGPGLLSFWWKTAFGTPSDRLLFWIGSWQAAAVANTADWEKRTFTVPPGDVNLRWTFANSSTDGQSRAWLDQVQFTPCDFRLSPYYGAWVGPLMSTGTVTLTAAADCPWHVVNTNSWITILSSVTNSGSGLVNYAVAANPSSVYRSGYIVIAEQDYYIYQYGGSSSNAAISLAEALDTGGSINWSTIGTPEWFGQTIVSRDGADAAQSGPVGDNGAVTATTTVNGPGTVLFWWRVSSETNKDYLKFFINGVQQTRISGEVDWQLLTYNLVSGTNLLKWTYSKNDDVAVGQDRGWLDQVQFVPTPATGLCGVAVSPISATHSGNSETGFTSVVIAAGCGWDVVNTNSWITYVASNGFVRYTVSANNSREPRIGVILIGGRPFTVTQLNGLPACSYSLSPVSSSHGYGSSLGGFFVTAPSGCPWNVFNTNSWITSITSSSSSGNGQVNYSVSQNTSPVARSGQISVGGQNFTVNQSGVPLTLAEALDTVGTPFVWCSGAYPWVGTTSVTHDGVDAALSAGTASSSMAANVTGPGTLTFWWKVSSFPNSSLRFYLSGSEQVRISGELDWEQRTITIPVGSHYVEWYFAKTVAGPVDRGWVDQVVFVSIPSCPVTLSPGNASHPSILSTGLVSVAAASDCAWSVFNTNTWISILSGTNGTGNGIVTYRVANNPVASARSGNVRIADKLFFVTQAGTPNCAISISPGSHTHESGSATGTVSVTTQAGCWWSVFNSNTWVTVASPSMNSSNIGSGQAVYFVSENTTTFARSGNVSIGGQVFFISQSAAPDPNLVTLSEALDTVGTPFVWNTSQNNPWSGQTNVTHDGADAAVSSSIGNSSSSGLQTGINGPGTLTFWWKVSSETNNDTLRLHVSGTEQSRISGEVDWQQRSVTLAAGYHWLEWTYIKNGAIAAGQDRGWVDQFQFVPGINSNCIITLSPNSRTHESAGETNTVTVTTETGCPWNVFETSSWITILSGLTNWDNGTVIYRLAPNTSSQTRTATIQIGGQVFAIDQAGTTNNTVTLPEALDTEGTPLVWTTGGTVPWFGQAAVSHDGADAGQSGAIPDAGNSSLHTTVSGPGTLSFWWKVSSETNNDTLHLSMNGVAQAGISGEVDWQQRSLTVPSGSQVLEWRYSKNAAIATGQDRGWVDQVQFVPASGCSISLSATSASHGSGSSTGIVGVTVWGCAWGVVNTNPWVAIVSGTSTNGAGSGTLVYTVAANASTSIRSGNIRIGGENFLITQAGNSAGCTISILPGSATHGSGNATGTVAVTTQTGCAWSVMRTNSWIDILSSTNNWSSGTVTYLLAPNTNTQTRIGNIMIGGQQFLLTQAGALLSGTNAPRLRFMGRTATGATLSVQGEEGKMYVVECSQDLIHWLPISTNSAPSTVTDAAVGNAPQRFYRTVEVP